MLSTGLQLAGIWRVPRYPRRCWRLENVVARAPRKCVNAGASW